MILVCNTLHFQEKKIQSCIEYEKKIAKRNRKSFLKGKQTVPYINERAAVEWVVKSRFVGLS